MLECAGPYYDFGSFRLLPEERRLERNGRPTPLRRKAFDTLLLLVEKSGHLVRKEELIQRVWGDTIVLEIGLARNISTLRKVLGQRPDGKPYIETVKGHGYRLSGEAIERKVPAAPSTSEAKVSFGALSVKSIAVLPLRNLHPDGDRERFDLGMTDAIITQLCSLSGTSVLSTGAVTRFVHSFPEDVAAGQSLQVDAVIEGSIQRQEKRVRVTLRMIRVRDRRPLWADKFDCAAPNSFAAQDAISEQVANALAPRMTWEGPAIPPDAGKKNEGAHACYLRGQYYCGKRTADGVQNGMRQFREALIQDPNYALASIALADGYVLMNFYADVPAREAFRQAKLTAMRALEIDPALGEAHASLGFLSLVHEFDWHAAGRQLELAIQLSPDDSKTLHWYGWYLGVAGRFPEAISVLQRAQSLDPVSKIISTNLGAMYYFAREFDKAENQLRMVLEMDDNFAQAHQDIGRVYLGKKDFDRALTAARRAIEISGNTSKSLGVLGCAYAATGDDEKARQTLADLRRFASQNCTCPMAWVHCALGEREKALDWLQRALDERCGLAHTIPVDPLLDPVRSDSRFPTLR